MFPFCSRGIQCHGFSSSHLFLRQALPPLQEGGWRRGYLKPRLETDQDALETMVQIACLATTFLRTRRWGNPLPGPKPCPASFSWILWGSDPACPRNVPSNEPHHLCSFSVIHWPKIQLHKDDGVEAHLYPKELTFDSVISIPLIDRVLIPSGT